MATRIAAVLTEDLSVALARRTEATGATAAGLIRVALRFVLEPELKEIARDGLPSSQRHEPRA